MKTMDKMLLILLVTVLTFVGVVVIFNALDKLVQDSLIYTFLGMCSTELVAMGGIQIFKGKQKKKKGPTK